MLDKFEKFNRRLSVWFELIWVAGMLVILFITCIDVVGAKIFSWRLFGAIDVVMLTQIVTIAFAMSITLVLGRHINVDLFMGRLSKRLDGIIESIALLLGLGFFLVVVWQFFVLGYSFQTSGEHSATARIAYHPFTYGIAIAGIPVCMVYLQKFLSALIKVVKG